MMIETSTAPVADQPRDPQVVDATAETEAAPEPTAEPAPTKIDPPAPRKTWSVPKAPPKGSVDGPKTKKKTLMEIMEEEKQQEQATQIAKQEKLNQRLLEEEEAALVQAMQASVATESAPANDMDADLKLALMLSMQDGPQSDAKLPPASPTAAAAVSVGVFPPAAVPVAAAASASVGSSKKEENGALTEEEMKEIERALQEADAAESAKTDAESLRLALELQNEEDGKVRTKQQQQKRVPQGNVRTMHRDDFLREQGKGGDHHYDHMDMGYGNDDGDAYLEEEDYYDVDEHGASEAGFRINSTKQSPWSRADGATIRGPNQELRTKHDPKLQGQANAYRLELRADDITGERVHVGNKAFNSFHRSMQKKTVKGVAAHGHGRATADADKTRDGALDGRVRLQIARAVNNGLIDTFNGCVKEGKEALVFHAEQGANSEGFDVAVKVFKRISEFRNRGQYVEGDPRYGDGKNFRHAGSRQQVEMWAEKEHRNLTRAYRSKVPVPRPLLQKENVLFLRFLGEEGWPSPQLRELDIKKGSKKWTALYEQTMSAIQLLYCDAKLVHGDLSEYNILVCPVRFLERFDDGVKEAKAGGEDSTEQKPAAVDNSGDKMVPAADSAKGEGKAETKLPAVAEPGDVEKELPASKDVAKAGDTLRIVLIDFGQAVDLRHPDSEELLERDVTRVKQFFDKMGITTTGVAAAMAYVQTKGAPLR